MKIRSLIQHLQKLPDFAPHRFHPVIVTDIDGVLVRGKTPIPETLEALTKLRKENIPYACLTNGGGQLESFKTTKLNNQFGVQDYFTPQMMFMNYTPLRPRIREHSLQDGNLLITGSLMVKNILDDMKIRNYVTADELNHLYLSSKQNQNTSSDFKFKAISQLQAKEQVLEDIRLRFGNLPFPTSFQEWADSISSIFGLNDISPYETTLAVMHNIFQHRKSKQQRCPPYYAAQNDAIWAASYPKSRMAYGPFNTMLETHCEKHQFSLEKHYYGKPELKAFGFVEAELRQRFPQATFFMIGDNPRADIRGANRIGWASFLTRTGIHLSQENDPLDPATCLVYNFAEAVELVLQMKKEVRKGW